MPEFPVVFGGDFAPHWSPGLEMDDEQQSNSSQPAPLTMNQGGGASSATPGGLVRRPDRVPSGLPARPAAPAASSTSVPIPPAQPGGAPPAHGGTSSAITEIAEGEVSLPSLGPIPSQPPSVSTLPQLARRMSGHLFIPGGQTTTTTRNAESGARNTAPQPVRRSITIPITDG